jgi:hypothetical protein
MCLRPITEKFQPVDHFFRRESFGKFRQTSQQFSDRTLRRNDDSRVMISGGDPVVMKIREVGDVERHDDAPVLGRPGQLSFVGLAAAPRFGRRNGIESGLSQSRGDRAP